MEFDYETESIAYEDYDRLVSYTVEEGSDSFTGNVGKEKAVLIDDNECVWNIDVMLTFNEIEITVEVNKESIDEFGYEYIDFDSGSQFENWCENNNVSLN